MNVRHRIERQAKIETALAAITGFLFLLTLVTREWIEALTGWDPDHGNGSLEWLIVAALLAATVALSLRARADLRKVQALPV